MGVCAQSLQSCPTFCDPVDCSPPGSFVHWILQTRTLEWAAISFSRGSSQPRLQTHVSCIPCIGRHVLYQLCLLESPWIHSSSQISPVCLPHIRLFSRLTHVVPSFPHLQKSFSFTFQVLKVCLQCYRLCAAFLGFLQ